MRALAGIVLALALASPATAATVTRTVPEAGPVLAGPDVLWGSEGSDGSARVMAGAPGRPPRLVHRIAAPTGRDTTRWIGPLAASQEAFAVRVSTATLAGSGFDWVAHVTDGALLAGPLGGGPSLLYGSLPERVEQGSCEGEYDELGALDVDGPRVAVAWEHRPCTMLERTRVSIAVHDGGSRGVVDAGPGVRPFEVRLAGRLLAWTRFNREIVVHDLESGTDVSRIRARDAGARSIGDDFALQPDGTVVFTAWARRFRRGSRLAAVVPGSPGVRLLDRHAGGPLALADGRVLYDRLLDDSYRRTALVLRPLAGGPPRTLARLGENLELTGTLDLDATRATWAVKAADDEKTGRIVVREL